MLDEDSSSSNQETGWRTGSLTPIFYHPAEDGIIEAETYRLELILGPMFGGKTTELLRRVRDRSRYQPNILCVNTNNDTRYGEHGIITHDKITFPAERVKDLYDLLEFDTYKMAPVVAIDEGNHFDEIFDFVTHQLEVTKKTFIISGLQGDKDKKLFGSLHRLIPHAEELTFLKPFCTSCANGTKASFSIDVVKFCGQIKIGSDDAFKSVCRRCYGRIRMTQSVEATRKSI